MECGDYSPVRDALSVFPSVLATAFSTVLTVSFTVAMLASADLGVGGPPVKALACGH